MTHGEEWYRWKCSINSFEYKFDRAEQPPKIKKRMNKEDAIVYYSKKCREVFEEIGFNYKEPDNFESKLEYSFLVVRAETEKMLKREVKKIQRLLRCGEYQEVTESGYCTTMISQS